MHSYPPPFPARNSVAVEAVHQDFWSTLTIERCANGFIARTYDANTDRTLAYIAGSVDELIETIKQLAVTQKLMGGNK